MKINFTDEEKFRIRLFIQRYSKVSSNIEKLKKDAIKISESISEESAKLNDIVKEEKDFMNELHEKYGNFSIQDISENI